MPRLPRYALPGHPPPVIRPYMSWPLRKGRCAADTEAKYRRAARQGAGRVSW